MGIHDIPVNELIERAATRLKEIDTIKPPEWAPFVRTAVHKERPPVNPDWWYVRAASILRKTFIKGPIGVSHLRKEYSGKGNNGVKGEHSKKGGGNIIRKILQQLEASGLVKQVVKGTHKGRIITPKGMSLLEKK